MSKPSLPKGTRDFLPQQVNKRRYIFDTIETVFKTFGYLPIETPAMELLSTLTGKYGEEGDRLLFKILNNGDFLADADKEAIEKLDSNQLIPSIARRGLRYDLTVPFARFVVMHQNDIQFPFKRYQIQPVWRADRPQKGRYQEFFQCDVDVVGSDSLMYEAELVQIYSEVFKKLGLSVKIHINNRKILYGIAEAAGIPDKFVDMTVAIDKLDKIGFDGVKSELLSRNIPESSADQILSWVQIQSPEVLKSALQNSEEGKKGIEEIEKVWQYLQGGVTELVFDVTLARGLGYYTGCIFEVKVDTAVYPGFSMGSIGGGGRYDNLTGVFGLKGVSGVGVSFGAERIYDALEELNLFPEYVAGDIRILFVALDEESHRYAFGQVLSLRQNGIAADLYPEPAKMKKQMSYANARNVPYVAIIGEEERKNEVISLKNMTTGEQRNVGFIELMEEVKNQLK
ncbi:MAG: histidine--tRNA ligase [Saprospiraceae bacterium]|nr:histidine--tRNA ligase [Saprospiraceae bacterium]